MSTLMIRLISDDLELQPGGTMSVSPDKDAVGRVRVGLTLTAEWTREDDAPPDPPLHVLEELVSGCEQAINEAIASDSEESVDYKRVPSQAFVLAIGSHQAAITDDYVSFTARCAYVRVQGSAKRTKVTAKLVLGGVDAEHLALLGKAVALRQATLANPQTDLFVAPAA